LKETRRRSWIEGGREGREVGRKGQGGLSSEEELEGGIVEGT